MASDTRLLGESDLRHIVKLLQSALPQYVDWKQIALAVLPDDYAQSLSNASNSKFQLESDLAALNRQLSLTDFDGPPLAAWLDKASALAQPKPEAQHLSDLADQARQSASAIERDRKVRTRVAARSP